jgi:hypothetical protein
VAYFSINTLAHFSVGIYSFTESFGTIGVVGSVFCRAKAVNALKNMAIKTAYLIMLQS